MQTATLALTGDVMLGRLVDESVIRNHALPPETPWGNVRPLLLEADLRLINLEEGHKVGDVARVVLEEEEEGAPSEGMEDAAQLEEQLELPSEEE